MNKRSAPEFWARRGFAQALLEPLAWGYGAAGAVRFALAHPYRASVPVLCVGNVVAGGAGKTPVALTLARLLGAKGARPFCLTRGYGGEARGPLLVDPARHDAAQVGDEALLLAAQAPTIVAQDRAAGARVAEAAGADIIVMDDGLQNPHVAKDLSLVVVDGAYGFGNGRLIPAGPLREPVARALARSDAVVLIGADEAGATRLLAGKRVLEAVLAPALGTLPSGPVLAFAGIARPEKFFRTIDEAGGTIAARYGFPDHHVYGEAELEALAIEAARLQATLLTTAKDAVRLSPSWRARVAVLAVELIFRDEAALAALVAPLSGRARG